MKVKILNWILVVDILSVLLLLVIFLAPSNAARIILGLPFLLYFPGFLLVSAVFAVEPSDTSKRPFQNEQSRPGPEQEDDSSNHDHETACNRGEKGPGKKRGIDRIERFGLSFVMSIAITALFGFCLNYTPWGLRLTPILITLSILILGLSIIAVLRQIRNPPGFRLTTEYSIKVPGWEGHLLNRILTVILAITILGSISTLGYVIVKPKTGEAFSEFYILGANGKVDEYPTTFVMVSGKTIQVSYGNGTSLIDSNIGNLTVGIINREQQTSRYSVALQIDSQAAEIIFDGRAYNRLQYITLEPGEKWEKEIGFSPQHTGENQKVQLFLYENEVDRVEKILQIWVDVKEKG